MEVDLSEAINNHDLAEVNIMLRMLLSRRWDRLKR